MALSVGIMIVYVLVNVLWFDNGNGNTKLFAELTDFSPAMETNV